MDEQGGSDCKYAFKWREDESAYLSESYVDWGVDFSIFSHKKSIKLTMTCTLPLPFTLPDNFSLWETISP